MPEKIHPWTGEDLHFYPQILERSLQYLGIEALKQHAAEANTAVFAVPVGTNLVPMLNLNK